MDVPLQEIFLSVLCMIICVAWNKEVMAVKYNAFQYFREHFDCIVTARHALPCLIDCTHIEANPSLARYFLTRFMLQPRL